MNNLCTVTFNAKNNLGVQFRLTMDFEIPIHSFAADKSDYFYVNDTDIKIAINKYCRQEGLTWWLDSDDCEIGGPPWNDICNLPVVSTVDY